MKILIVDDDSDSRKLLRYIIENKHHEAMEAEDGLEGLRSAKINSPDLIISDALMPVMDGFQFLKAVKEDEKLKTIPFIFYSAIYKADKDVDLAIALGAEAYIIKPKEPADLWEEVEIILLGQKKEKVITPELITEEEEYLKRYSQVVATKLEEKVAELEKEITEHERAEKEIVRAKEEWERTFDAITDPIMILDTAHRIVRANKAMYAAVKMTPKEVEGVACYTVVHGTTEPPTYCPLSKLLQDGKPHSAEVGEPRLGGHFIMSVSPLYAPDGTLYGSVHYSRDITERKWAEEKIKEEAEVSRSLLEIVGKLNSSLDEKDLIRSVIELAPHYLKFDRSAIYLYDEEIRAFVFAGGYGFSPVEEGLLVSKTFRKGDFPAVEMLLGGETVIIEDADETNLLSREVVKTFHIGSAVIVPVCFRQKLIGAVKGEYESVGPVAARDVSLLKGLADGIAIAIQNSRLYRESVERLMELSSKMETIRTMAQLDREILSNIDRNSILTAATALVNRVVPCERVAVILKDGTVFRVVSEWGLGKFINRTYDEKVLHATIVEERRGSLFFPDITMEKAVCQYHGELVDVGIQSSLLVPFITKGKVIGMLDISSSHCGRLSPSDLDTAENIAAQITVALENARLYEELEQLLINTIASLASAIDAKSSWTKGHSERVTNYAIEIAREMGLKDREIEQLRLAGLLHDIGKIGTYDVVLDKPGKLTDEEFKLVKKHPGKGAEILSPIRQLADIIPLILHHHETYDGNGYPGALKGEEIPLQARILTVADSFDSMTADRPYRPSPGRDYAISEFERCSGTQFDPGVVKAFLKVLNRPGDKRSEAYSFSSTTSAIP